MVVIDGDGTYPIADIPRLLEGMEGYDMVVGARTKEAGTLKFLRIPAKWMIRKLAEFMTGSRIPDLNSGMRAIRKDVFFKFESMLPPGHSWVSTITLCMLANSHPVHYMPIDYFPRKGKSTFHPIKDTANYFMLIFRTVTWFNPLRLFLPLTILLFLLGCGKMIADMANYDWRITTSTVVLLLASLQIFTLGMLADLMSKKGGRMTVRILVTGADGFVGCHLVDYLLQDVKAEVMGLGLRPDEPGTPWMQCDYRVCDVRDGDTLRRLVLEFQPGLRLPPGGPEFGQTVLGALGAHLRYRA